MKSILVVDNYRDVTEALRAALATETDYKIDVAYGGQEALDKMKANEPYNLLILDIMMPKINGIDVCKSVIEDERLKNIPVLLISVLPISSKTFQETREKFNELSIVKGVLEKPFSVDELIAKIRAIISK